MRAKDKGAKRGVRGGFSASGGEGLIKGGRGRWREGNRDGGQAERRREALEEGMEHD